MANWQRVYHVVIRLVRGGVQKGFTLLELIVVVVSVAILAAIIVFFNAQA